DRARGITLDGLDDRGDLDLGVRGRFAVGKSARQRLPGRDRFVGFPLVAQAASDQKEDFGDVGIERVPRDVVLPDRSRVREPPMALMFGGGPQLRLEDGALGAGGVWAAGVFCEVTPPCGDRLGKSPLLAQEAADL